MSIVAETVEHVIGIDSHARTHTYCLVHARTGAAVDTATFPTTKAGNARAIDWIGRRAQGSVLAAIEGTSSCLAPGLMEALNPREDESHGGTEEVPRRAAGAGDSVGGRRPA
jgi:hypothetical protein